MRISLLGILSKTERLRRLYGRGLAVALEIALTALDAAGVYRTTPDERVIDVGWAAPIPVEESQALANAVIKRDLGVPAEVILAELGYAPKGE